MPKVKMVRTAYAAITRDNEIVKDSMSMFRFHAEEYAKIAKLPVAILTITYEVGEDSQS